jgi:glycerol-3-phosphate cytidylyltransferase
MKQNKKSVNNIIGFTCGSFDLLHAGHALMLKECKNYCDTLIVGLQKDPSADRNYKNKPVQTLEERRIMLESIKYIDKIYAYSTEKDLYSLLQLLTPDVRIVGSDWKDKKFTGHDLPIKVIFNTRNHNYSSSSLRRRVYTAESKKRDIMNIIA